MSLNNINFNTDNIKKQRNNNDLIPSDLKIKMFNSQNETILLQDKFLNDQSLDNKFEESSDIINNYVENLDVNIESNNLNKLKINYNADFIEVPQLKCKIKTEPIKVFIYI